MTVGELKKLLEDVPDDYNVIKSGNESGKNVEDFFIDGMMHEIILW